MGCGGTKVAVEEDARSPTETPTSSDGQKLTQSVSSWVKNGMLDFDVPEETAGKSPTIGELQTAKPHETARLSSKMKRLVRQSHTKKRIRKRGSTSELVPPEELRKYFKEYAIKDPTDQTSMGHIGLVEFKTICGFLNLDFTELEVEKIFRVVDMDSQGRRDHQLEYTAFVKGVNRGDFLKHVITDSSSVTPFDVPVSYDYTKSTNENYQNKDTRQFVGDFTDIRAARDYKYHANYTKSRQLWQDSVIKSVVVKTQPQTQPWIVYTCGPMGAGKGYSLSWMSTQGAFPLENIVHIDPDYFKTTMPEWEGYVDAGAGRDGGTEDGPGTMCHRESGFMQELAQDAALNTHQNIWVDGSLRDGLWFEKVFIDLRRRFPTYKIAIFYVYAAEDVIRSRVQQRAAETGRDVPEKLLEASLHAADKSLGILMPYVDFVARINNAGPAPKLAAFESVDRTGAWLPIQKRFAKTQASQVEFPNRLSPLFISSSDFPTEAILLTSSTKRMLQNFSGEEGLQVELDTEILVANLPQLSVNKSCPDVLTSTMSPAFPVNADSETRLLANVPGDSFSFAYCYGVANFASLVKKPGGIQASPALSFLNNGGFVYFNLKQEIVGITAVRAVPTNSLLHFGACTELTDEEAHIMNERMAERFQICTLPFMIEKGCTEYAFVCPGETFNSNVPNFSGGFAYRFAKDSAYRDRIFPIIAAV